MNAPALVTVTATATALALSAPAADTPTVPPPPLDVSPANTAKPFRASSLDSAQMRRLLRLDPVEKKRTEKKPDSLGSAKVPAVWSRLAACESTSRWHIQNPPYSSGLQFLDSSWDAYRPANYPDSAWQASPAQQVFVGKRLLRAQGPGAWPVCGPRAGLTMADAA